MLFPLVTERLLLRHFHESDLDAFHAYRNDPEVFQYQGWHVPYLRETAAEFIAEMKDAVPGVEGCWFQAAVQRKSDHALIGDVAFCPMRGDARQAFFGFTLARRFWMTFRNVWPGMPRSLKNIDMAIDALRLIATEASLDSMQSGNFNERRDALERFWARKDPTPGTIYNEAMTEFYRRVDHVRAAYGTMQEPDGIKSDRGRIYILNGQPTRVDRTLNPSVGFTETWTYEKTKRTFTFVDERRNGTYKLAVSTK